VLQMKRGEKNESAYEKKKTVPERCWGGAKREKIYRLSKRKMEKALVNAAAKKIAGKNPLIRKEKGGGNNKGVASGNYGEGSRFFRAKKARLPNTPKKAYW